MDTISTHSAAPIALAERQLRQVLAANATTSLLGGLVALAAGPTLDEVLGTGHPGWVRVVGALLVMFGIAVAIATRTRGAGLRRAALGVSIADAAWVIATIATVAAGWYSTSGALLMGVVAIAVADFCAVQVHLARRIWA